MKKFLFACFNVLLVAAIVCAVTFGIMWDNNRNQSNNADDANQAIILELKEELASVNKSKEEVLAEKALLEGENSILKTDCDSLRSENANLGLEVENRDKIIAENEKTIASKEETIAKNEQKIADLNIKIAEYEKQIQDLNTRILQLSTELDSAYDYLDFYKYEQIDFQMTSDQLTESGLRYLYDNRVVSIVDIDSAYLNSDELVLILNIKNGARVPGLGYFKLRLNPNYLTKENLNVENFLSAIAEQTAKPRPLAESDKVYEVVNVGYQMNNLDQFKVRMKKYLADPNSKLFKYVEENEDKLYRVCGLDVKFNEFYFGYNDSYLVSESGETTEKYLTFDTLILKDGKFKACVQMPYCLYDDRPLTEDGKVDYEQIYINLFEYYNTGEKWVEPAKYEVKFVDNAGDTENVIATQLVYVNGYATAVEAPAKEGYVFDYWTTDGQTEVDVANYIITLNVTFIAKYVSTDFAFTSVNFINKVSCNGTAQEYFSVGDERDITLTTGETITVVILGFNHDDLSDGTGKAGISLGMKNLLTTKYRIDESASPSSWDSSTMRTQTLVNILSQMPQEWQNVIKSVDKKSFCCGGSTEILTTSEKLWLFSLAEIAPSETFDNISLYDDGVCDYMHKYEGSQYEYFNGKVEFSSVDSANSFLVKQLGGKKDYNSSWILRSGINNKTVLYYAIGSSGKIDTGHTILASGVCFGFCV